jgi:hypothetical protein
MLYTSMLISAATHYHYYLNNNILFKKKIIICTYYYFKGNFQNLIAKIPQTKNKIKVPVLLAFLSQKIPLRLLHTVRYYGKW